MALRSRGRQRAEKKEEVRPPCVAGLFYPEQERSLAEWVDRLLAHAPRKEPAVALIVPHGPYRDSGPVAGAVYAQVKWPPTAVMVGPNHAGMGKPFAVMTAGRWETPVGALEVDEPLAKRIVKAAPPLAKDAKPHREEHSIEVQLPFLKRLKGCRKFVPVAVESDDTEALSQAGEGIAKAMQKHSEETILIGTANLSRYEPAESVKAQDRLVLDSILAFREQELLERVRANRISMCGVGAVAVVLAAARRLGATRARLVRYEVGSEEGNEHGSAVGYAGVILQ